MQEENVHTDNRFINVRTGEVVEITGTDAELSKVVTVTATERHIRPRTMKTTSLKTTYLNQHGIPWKSAYVALRVLPEDHPMAASAEPVLMPESDTLPDFSAMNDVEMSAYANAQKAKAEMYGNRLGQAKAALARRHPQVRPYLRGNVYLGISPNNRFDGKLAKTVLTDEEYQSILVAKPDATVAKEVLPEGRYKLICKDFDHKVEIRPATDSDRRKIAELEETLAATGLDEAPEAQNDDPFLSDYAL